MSSHADADELVTLTLPAVTQPDSFLETVAGRLIVPGVALAEKNIVIRPSLVSDLTGSARAAAVAAHAPYSCFHVGAAVVMADDPAGQVFLGSNVENASYGATICAERGAILAAAAAGFRRIGLLAVSTVDALDGPLPGRSPCGVCRQVIREFADESTLVVIDSGETGVLGEVMDIDRLLPWGFTLGAGEG